MQTRSTVMARNAVVTSSHQLASFHGANIIRNGGNVFDALITTSSVLTVVQNNLCGIGGDLFALLRGPDGAIREINGSGRAAGNATIEMYEKQGLGSIPDRGPLAGITVPGIVDAWREINEKYCSMELPELLKPAISIAEDGYPLTRKYVQSISATSRHLSGQKGWESLFMPGGKIPEEGELFKQKLLAESLRAIAEEGPETFYKGRLMEKIVAGIKENGGLFEEDDFRNHQSTWEKPLKTSYHGVDIYETYPNTQGATISLWLNLLERFGDDSLKSNESRSLPLLLKTGLRAYMARAKYITDPKFHDLPGDFTSIGFAERVMEEPVEEWDAPPGKEDGGDTTYFCLTDREGNSASVIQSNYMGFGSGMSPTNTGFIIHNRGSYFSLDRNHHNSLQPGKRTFHTLCAAMGETDGEMSFIAGTMGGDIQPQVNIQIINRIIDRKMDVQDALDYPRWAFFGTIYEKPAVLSAEESLMPVIQGTDTQGLRLEKIPDMSSMTGHAQAIVFGRKGGLYAGSDPRGDGIASGF